jgi:predicted DNA binding CopG/RHH family protein
MRDEYDFSKARPGRLAEGWKQQITIRIDQDALDYFKELASETGLPYQTLINLYLKDCAKKRLTLEFRRT